MIHVKITAIGNSAGVLLPKELLARLGVERGDTLEVVDDGGPGLRFVKSDDAYCRALAAGRECMDRYPLALAELAK